MRVKERIVRTVLLISMCGLTGGSALAQTQTPARGGSLTVHLAPFSPIIALIAGILILIMPRLLNFIVAIYLIIIGLVGLGLLRWLHL